MRRVVVVDDDVLFARAIARLLGHHGFEVETLHDGEAAADRLLQDDFDLMLLDLELPPPDGWELLARARSLPDPPAVVVVSGRVDVELAVRALHLGAADCISKAAAGDAGLLLEKIMRAIDRLGCPPEKGALVAESPAMRQVVALAHRVARSPSTPVLLLGESGVGKEVVARRVHAMSSRAEGPFVAVNLAALPDTLVESELFGHARGSFTGSAGDREGKFRTAAGGTILLDELCEMKPALQSKLLRVLETRRFFPVGADTELPTDARVITATNRDPHRAIDEGVLREDLYYRLSTVTIRIPPLRERPEDIRPLVTSLLGQLAREHGTPPRQVSADGLAFLESRAWPGNVRELRNLLERTMVLEDGDTLTALRLRRATEASQPPPGIADSGWDLMRTTQNAAMAVEREQIRHALRLSQGAVGKASELLGVSRTTLWSKMKKHGIEPD